MRRKRLSIKRRLSNIVWIPFGGRRTYAHNVIRADVKELRALKKELRQMKNEHPKEWKKMGFAIREDISRLEKEVMDAKKMLN